MGRTWILDTETKGTGARVVPLESVKKRSAPVEPVLVPRKHAPPEKPAPAAEPRPPRKFKIVDLMTRQTLIEGASTRQAVDQLAGVRSIIDVNVYTWDEERDDWRLLTLSETRALWEFTGR